MTEMIFTTNGFLELCLMFIAFLGTRHSLLHWTELRDWCISIAIIQQNLFLGLKLHNSR